MEKMKNKGKKIVLLVCGILLALAVIAGGAAAVLFMNNGSFSEEAEYSGEVHIQDEQALRAALKSKGDCEIVLSEDIVITKELEVFGDKKLSGGSIIMDMRREGSGESVLAIQKGATLVLDGTTIDGNSVVNCISVKAGGELDSQSGSLVYGYPYGLNVAGKVTITDILIDEALHTGVNVSIFGEVDMLGGTISQNVYGIAVAEEGRMDIADGVTMVKSIASFIVNYGKMNIIGGKYDGSNDNAIENWGTMDIRGTASEPIEICNGTKSAINAKNNAKLTAEHIKIYDMGWHGMCIEKNTTATLKDISFDNTGKSTLYVNSAKAKMENITILNGTAYGVYATKNADVTMTHVTIKDMKNRAVMNEAASVLTADDLVIENSAQHGVYTTGEKTITTINNATITGTARSAVAISSGTGTITNAYIADTEKEAVSVGAKGKVTVEDSTISNAGNFAIASYGGVANAKNVTITNSGNASVLAQDSGTFTGDGLTIKNAGKQAIRIEKSATAKVTNCQIDTTQAAAVYVDNAKLTMKSAVINNSKTYGVAAKNCKKANGQIVQLDKVTVNNPGEHGIGSINAYMVAGNIKVTNPRRCGVYSEGAEAIINMAHIEVYNAGTCGLGFKGAAEITARNVTIDSPKNEGVLALAGANVKKLDNITVKDPGSHGISVEGEAIVNVTVDTKYNPENIKGNGVTVLGPGKNGIRCSNGTVSATGVTIKNAGGQGISANKESKVTVNGCTIDTTVQAAVYAEESKLTLKNATIDNAGTYGVAAKNGAKEKEQMVQLTDVEINKPGEHGIGSINAYMVAGNVKVTEPKRCGVYSEGEEAIINMAGIEVYDAGTCGFGFKGAAEITARNVTIDNPKNEGIYALAGANVKKLDNVIIENPGTHGISVEGQATVTVTVDTNYNPENTTGNGATILNPGKYGILIATGSEATVSGSTVKNAGERAVHAAGVLRVNGLTLDGATGHGIYLGANASLSGSDLTVCNTGDNGIFSEGAPIEIAGFTLENTKNQGVQVKGGTVQFSDFTVKEAGGVAMRVRNTAKVTLTNGTIYADTYGIYCDGSTETTATDVTVERTGKKSDALVGVTGSAKLEIAGETKLDNKDHKGNGILVDSANAVLVLNGGSFVGEAKDYVDVLLNKDGTAISLAKKLTESISLQPNKYEHGRVVAKNENISDADFGASMALIVLTDDDWTVNNAGCLSNPDGIVASIGEVTYTTLEAAVADANASAGADTIKILKDAVTIGARLDITSDVTITADKAVTITAGMSGGMFNITNGTLAITGVSETAKISLAAGTQTTNMVYTNGGNADLTNVELIGNKNSTAGNNSTYGIYNNVGHVTAKSVTIKDIVKGDGINIRAGASADLDNVSISGTGRYGIKSYGTVNLYNTANAGQALSISNTNDHAIDLEGSGGKLISSFANVPAGTYAITIDGTVKSSARGILVRAGAELAVTDVNIQNVKNNGVDILAASSAVSISNATIAADGYCIQTAADTNLTVSNVTVCKCGTTAVDIKGNLNGEITFTHTVEHVAAVAPTFEAAGNIEYWYCTVCGTAWKDEARTQVIRLADVVLPKLEGAVASMNGTYYTTLEAAVAAANAADGAVAVTLLSNVTVAAQLDITGDVTITADKAVVVTGADALTGNIFRTAAGGKLTITGASETAMIALVQKVNKDVIVTSGTLNLNCVSVSGGQKGINVQNGGSLIASNIEVSGTSGQGIYLTGANATAEVTDFVVSETGSAAIRPMNGAKIELTDGTIYADTYGVAVDGTTETVLNNVIVERTGKKTDPLVNIAGSAKLEIAGTTKLDNKGYNGNGINVDSASATVILSGGSFIGETEGYVDVVLNKKDATISLAKALAESVSVKPVEYTEGLAIAEKFGEISNADFEASTALLIPADTDWIVDNAGKLAKSSCAHVWGEEVTTQPTCSAAGVKTYTCSVCGDSYTEAIPAAGHTVSHVAFVAPSLEAAGNIEYWYCTVCSTYWKDEAQTQVIDSASVTLPQVTAGNVAYMNGTAYTTLEAAVAAASEGDTIHLLDSTTINAQIKPAVSVTIKAAKPVTITANIQQAFYVDTGKTLTMEGSGSNIITVICNLTGSNDHVFVNKGTMNLTNVTTSGGYRGLYIAGGTVEVNNVTIKNTKNHGVYMAKNTSLTGSELTLENIGSNGIFSEGSTVTIDGLQITNTGGQAVQAKGGVITISNFAISGTGSAALRPSSTSGVKFILTNGTVTTDTYGLAMDSSKQEVALTNVTFVRTGTSTVAVLNVTSSAILTADNVTVNIPSEFNALNINGANTYTGITVVTEE